MWILHFFHTMTEYGIQKTIQFCMNGPNQIDGSPGDTHNMEIPNQLMANTCYQIKTISLRLTASPCCYKFVAHTLSEAVYRSSPLQRCGTNKHTDQIYNFMKNDPIEQSRRIHENKQANNERSEGLWAALTTWELFMGWPGRAGCTSYFKLISLLRRSDVGLLVFKI